MQVGAETSKSLQAFLVLKWYMRLVFDKDRSKKKSTKSKRTYQKSNVVEEFEALKENLAENAVSAATTLIYAIGTEIVAAAGIRPALRLILVKGFKL
ncbi:hypothetical protein A0J61_07287 [Choanephora cucurbitarum]|uniref:Uncharacterized protein n=1 Tax=Choanephora cucurbitarum TaxID=101091 RepID=A0A1C7NBE7_9FUNG|nr:hypothetical protein A0J61_07287 [Choanephora cucurbitarum]